MKQLLRERELKSLKKAKKIVDSILKIGAMDSKDAEELSNAGASILFTGKAFDYTS